MGLAKKVLLADTFAGFASPIFDRASRGDIPMFFDAWVGALAYAFQLYFAFSGYSDMALGLSLFFGIRLPLNFNSPYKARSIIDFWRRWHITLSTFLRDYLYLPLGGNRKGESRRFINLIVTMILGGLWHGAVWTFVVWGFLHAAYLCANHGWRHLTRRSELEPVSRLKDGVSLIVTFVAVVVAWVPFRAADMHSAVVVWKGLAGANGFSVPVRLQERLPSSVGALVEGRGFTPLMDAAPATTLLLILVGLIAVWALHNTQEILRSRSPAYDVRALHRTRLAWQPRPAVAVLAGATLGICILSFRRNSPFLYFQF